MRLLADGLKPYVDITEIALGRDAYSNADVIEHHLVSGWLLFSMSTERAVFVKPAAGCQVLLIESGLFAGER